MRPRAGAVAGADHVSQLVVQRACVLVLQPECVLVLQPDNAGHLRQVSASGALTMRSFRRPCAAGQVTRRADPAVQGSESHDGGVVSTRSTAARG